MSFGSGINGVVGTGIPLSLSFSASASGASLTSFYSSGLNDGESSDVFLPSSSIASCFWARRRFNASCAACELLKLVLSLTLITGQVVPAASPSSSHCRGRKTNSSPFWGRGVPFVAFPKVTHRQMWFSIRTVHNDSSNRRVRHPSETLPRLFGRVLHRRFSQLGLIQALQKEKIH